MPAQGVLKAAFMKSASSLRKQPGQLALTQVHCQSQVSQKVQLPRLSRPSFWMLTKPNRPPELNITVEGCVDPRNRCHLPSDSTTFVPSSGACQPAILPGFARARPPTFRSEAVLLWCRLGTGCKVRTIPRLVGRNTVDRGQSSLKVLPRASRLLHSRSGQIGPPPASSEGYRHGHDDSANLEGAPLLVRFLPYPCHAAHSM